MADGVEEVAAAAEEKQVEEQPAATEETAPEAKEETPTTEAAVETPATEAPTETPAAEAAAETPAEAPAETPATEAAAESPATEVPAETPAAEAAAGTPATEAPAETPAAEVPAETPATEVPAETPATETPAETPAGEATEPAAEKPAAAPAAAPAEEEKIEEPDPLAKPKDFCYKETDIEVARLPLPFELDPSFCDAYSSFGFPCSKRNNVHYLDLGVLLFVAGNTVQVLDLYSKVPGKKKIIFGHGNKGGCGVGAVAVHPKKTHFAVAEKGINPNIFIYEYPSFKIVRCCRLGTERAYSDVTFDKTGTKLASVGSEPDYLLTVWDWDRELVVLRTKAFSQEVFRVNFSPLQDGQLLTSGTGHIRFWKMAATFTGLKLQGDIGKFGNVELSDISAYCELPGGRVISGSESGDLLMWEGNLIQFSICRGPDSPCHSSAIEFVELEDNMLITAGQDGYIRKWDFSKIEFAEVSEELMFVYVEPEMEVQVAEDCKIMGMLRGDDHWVIQDANCGLYQLWTASWDVEKILDVHAGPVTSVISCPYEGHSSITGGMDGTVRTWDVLNRENIVTKKFNSGVTSLVWAPATVDATQNTVVCGFDDGCVRVLKRYSGAFRLMKTIKPHTATVTNVKISPDGSVLATASSDKTLFFLAIEGHGSRFSPLGFVPLDHPAISLNWSNDSRYLLLASGSEVIQFSRPEADQFLGQDSSRDTYAIELPCRKFRPKIAYQEPDADSDYEEDTEEGAEAKPIEPPVREITYPEEKISAVLPSDQNGMFYICIDGGSEKYPDERYETLYECNFIQEEPLRKIHLNEGVGTVSFLGFSQTQKFLLVGSRNGNVQMRPVSDLEFFLQMKSHDGDDGAVSAICTTFDDRILLSTGQDGNFFAHTVDGDAALARADRAHQEKIREMLDWEKEAPQRARELRRKNRKKKKEYDDAIERGDDDVPDYEPEVERPAPFSKKDIEQLRSSLDPREIVVTVQPPQEMPEELEPKNELDLDAEDITDSGTYSIEEAKLKQEEDDRMTEAEKKKQLVRQEIQDLRKEFQFMLKKNSILEPSQQLEREAFELDPKLRKQLEQEAEEKIAQVEKELAWVSEKHDLALKKLRKKFLDDLIVEHIRLKSFRTNTTVTCFRTPDLPPFLRESIQQVHEMIDTEEKNRREKDANRANSGEGDADDGLTSSRSAGAAAKKGATGPVQAKKVDSKGKSTNKKGGEAENRRKARAERKKQLEKLKASKPDKNVDDPMDVAAINYAERNMGDYKLKSDPNYVVPEHQRVNAERKRRQMVLLQESVHFIKMGFNERFLAMRDLKARMIKNIKKDNVRLRELNGLLEITDNELYEPELDSSEWPEHRELYTQDDLLEFQSKTSGSKTSATEAKTSKSKAQDSKSNDSKVQQTGDQKELSPMEVHEERLAMVPKSDMEVAEEKVARNLLQHERETLLEKIEFAIWTFDQALAKLRREKFKLDTDLKTTDLKVLTLYQELHLLKDFEESENKLFFKKNNHEKQKNDVVREKMECEKALSHKHAEIKGWQEKDKQVTADFDQVVGGQKSEFYAQLLKIFKKKVKRSKKKGGRDADEDGEDGDSDDDNFDSDDSDSDDESDDSEDDDDSCPMHCDSAIYEKVLELRERRLEQEDQLAEFDKKIKELQTTYERHTNREKAIDKDLANTLKDIELFQSTKQRALNQIEVTIPLKLSQMKYLVDDKLPGDISDALIFTSTGLAKLKNRITELQNEKHQLIKQFKDLKRGHKVLLKELSAKRELISIEQKRCEDVQMLKFGQIIDLSILAKVGVDEGAADLRRKLKGLEAGSVQKLSEWDKKIQDAKDELAKITAQNTRWLERVANLTKAQYDLEDQLNTTTKNVHVADSSPVDEKSDSDRRQLLQLVHIQEKEIDALKAEIHVLRRKGGHVYTPSS